MKNIENKFINAGGKAMRSYGSQDYPLVLQGPGVYVKCGDELTLIAGSGEGGGLIVDWDKIQGKPSWIGPNKPTYTKADVGLDQVDNTSDKDKPVSTATQTALNLKLDKSVWDVNISASDTLITLLKDTKVSGNGEVTGNLIVKGEATTFSLDGVETTVKASTGGANYIWELDDVDDLVKDAPDGSILIKNNGRWEAVESITINAGDYKII